MEQRIVVTDEHGRHLVALVTHDWLGREVVWSAEIEGKILSVPLTGTAEDKGSIPAAVQMTVLRWGIRAVADF
ncbi:hypothetical protein L2Y96_12425 [Luteibacter aegosomaticola]|uniref:hypothetical protein n=1 Tax=Luteibacter aegosomaticola TaxID=2911538 RepID=UPI001FF83E4F|nr:hypothetical protein [Luteibacter aegosomaticola]UPG88225.1 hypothetical protein L2Y96_12425 [Luteibacter aegosomaticola]